MRYFVYELAIMRNVCKSEHTYYYCLMCVYARLGLTLTKRMLDEHANTDVKSAEKIAPSRPFSADDLAAIAGTLQAFRR